jgi:hypothetical protein
MSGRRHRDSSGSVLQGISGKDEGSHHGLGSLNRMMSLPADSAGGGSASARSRRSTVSGMDALGLSSNKTSLKAQLERLKELNASALLGSHSLTDILPPLSPLDAR